MKTFRDRANALQRAAQQRRKIHSQSRPRQSRALERGLMVAGYDPGFVGDARRVRSDRNIIAARFDHTRSLTLLLRKNVAEDATFLALEVFPAGPQLVKHAPRHKHGGRDLRSRMAEF